MTDALYTSRLIKATALIPDTKALLAAWDLSQDWRTNFDNARRMNIFGKASRARIEDILNIFRQRYFDDPEVGQALVTLVQGHVPANWVDPLLYYYSVQNDRTLRAIILEVVTPRLLSGYTDVTLEHVQRALRDWVAEGKTVDKWGEETLVRVARHSLAALRDFGILQGKATKSITPLYLPVEAFTFLAYEIWRKDHAGDKALHSAEWNLFFLPIQGVERFFLEAHQERLLAYYAAGSVVRLEFPVNSLVEVARVLVERAHPAA
ncbi:MAG TPA: DUF1819 family protein [Anaerolineales bacterium]|nr:DUF1819 family protein [Anaerolineales bacterium]